MLFAGTKEEKQHLLEAQYSQAACTAIQLSLTVLLRSWGVHPEAVAGHSSGEIAAAFAAGYLSFEDAMTVAYQRGLASARLNKDFPHIRGSMIAVGTSENDTEDLITGLKQGTAVVACINSPTSVTISGDELAVEEVHSRAEAKGLFSRKLRVDTAYHSHHMEMVAPEYEKAIAGIRHVSGSGEVSFHSSLTGKKENMFDFDHAYWSDNLTSPVKFFQALQSLCSTHASKEERQELVLIEIGPHPALEGPIKQGLGRLKAEAPKATYLPTLVREQNAVESMQRAAASLFMAGCDLSIHPINNPASPEPKVEILTNLPPYVWNHAQRYWHSSRIGHNHQFRSFGRNDILGSLSDEASELEPVWRLVLDPDDVPWLRHHKVQGQIVFPLAAYLAMTVEGSCQKARMRGVDFGLASRVEFVIREIVSNRAMVVEESTDTEIMTYIRPYNQTSRISSDTWDEIRILSWSSGRNWIEHFRALVSAQKEQSSDSVPSFRRLDSNKTFFQERAVAIEQKCERDVNWGQYVDMFSRVGIGFGPSFQNLSNVRAGQDAAVTTVNISDTALLMPSEHETSYVIHPVTLDMCCQAVFPAFTHGLPSLRQTYMPTYIKAMTIEYGIRNQPGDRLRAYFSTDGNTSTGEIRGSGFVFDGSDRATLPAIRVEGLVLKPLSFQDIDSVDQRPSELCSQISWEPSLDFWCPTHSANLLSTSNIPDQERERVNVFEQGSFYWLQTALEQIAPDEYKSFQPHHQKFYDWAKMQIELARDRGLPMQTQDWLEADSLSRVRFLDDLKDHDTAGLMICNMGEALPQILRNQIDPLSVMTRDNLLEKWYRTNISLEVGYAQTANLINNIAYQNPFLNIIEIGAGTGGITLPTLEALGGYDGKTARFAKYTFTDISSGFFENAQTKLERREPLITFARLDIEKNPLEQGFEAGVYDLVIAANVLHATKNMENTLANTAKLLKPGGKLILVELTTQLLHHFMFATLPGWWLSEEPFRAMGPIVKKERWDELLRASGFSGVDLHAEDFPGRPEQSGSLMISTRLSDEKIDDEAKQIILLCDTEPNCIDLMHLQRRLESRLDAETSVETLATAKLEDKWCIFLEELNRPILANVNPSDFKRIQNLVLRRARGILWVVQNAWSASSSPDASMIFGLARTIRTETSCKLHVLDIDSNHSKPGGSDAAEIIAEVFSKTLLSKDSATYGETELVERGGVVQIPRILPDVEVSKTIDRNLNQAMPELQPLVQQGRPLKMRVTSPGHLDSMCFDDDTVARTPLEEDEVEISVKATSLNFKDVLIALGQVPHEDLGLECAGLVVATGKKVSGVYPGDRVCACVSSSFANYVRCPASSVAKLLDNVSYIEGASIPAVYATAYYGLVELAQLCEGESVLIHAACGGVGQAAVAIAQMKGAKIFATVSSEEKKLHLVNEFQIPENQIFYSRDTSFSENVMRATHDQGVDVVLNSLAGDLLHASWNILAPFGRFIEIGKRDLQLNSRLEMEVLLRNTAFMAMDLGALREKRPKVFAKVLNEVLELYQSKRLKPVTPLNVFSFSEIQKAFRLMETGKHIGKIVLEAHPEDKVKV